jgi:pimeloyl-ACP methyl ester carboxylesterase
MSDRPYSAADADAVTRSSLFAETFQSRKIKAADNVFLHAVIGGRGDPLILLHGFPQSWYMWRHLMLPLAERFTVVAPDLRGAGDSDKTQGPYDGWTLAGDVRGLLSKLGVTGRPWVVGHDMGAPVALSYAARYLSDTRGLIYIDEPVFGVNLEHLARFGADNPSPLWWWPFQHEPGLAEMLLAGHERAYFDFFVFSKMHVANHWAMTEQDKQEYVRHLCEVGGITGALGGYRAVFTTEAHLAKLKNQKLTLPVLGVSGEFGVQGVAEALRSYAELVEEAIIPASGHFIAEEQPQALLKVMLAFFEAH